MKREINVEYVKKRDGRIVPFSQEKITYAIFKAAQAIGGKDKRLSEKIADQVVKTLEKNFKNKIPEIEQIQDLVEKMLIEDGYAKTAKAYILYRAKRKEIRASKKKEVDSKDVKKLKKLGIPLTKQAIDVLNNSRQLDELGRAIFLDRYAIKSRKGDIGLGDLVVVVTKEDPKYPKKDVGVIKKVLSDDKLIIHMITGVQADPKKNYEYKQSKWRCEKPLESIDSAYKRVSKAIASGEKTADLKQKWFELFWDELKQNHIQPAGRIMTGANVDQYGRYTSNLTLYNCYVLPSPKDSRESIVKETLYQMTEIMSRGGGVGISLSTLRPRYAYVRGVHGKSSGSVSWGGLYSYTTGLIEQGGSRRGALMLMLADWHPDILEFIDSKRTAGVIENANISVMVSDRFMDAMKKDKIWNLEYPDYEHSAYSDLYDDEWDGDIDEWKRKNYPIKVYKKIKARTMWNKLVESAWASAEPGVVFMERYNKLSNSHYFNKLISTNPCGEQGLPGWGVCNLGHLYLASFAEKIGADKEGSLYKMNWDALKKAARILTRFLDNVIDVTPYHFKENEENQKKERRIGGGTLGLGELLIKLRIRYGSSKSLPFIDRIYKTICFEMYKESTRIAKEKGPFPKFDTDKFMQSGFVKTLSEEIQSMIKRNGIRNVTLTTQAPTGTVGTMLATSTGIEPYYAFEFYQQSRIGFHKVSIPLAKEYLRDGKLPKYFVSAMDLTPIEHIKVQAAVQKWTCSSISKTANAPSDFTFEQTREVYETAYDLGCKGVTIYRDKSRSEQVLSTSADTEKKNVESAKKGSKKISEALKLNKEDIIYGSQPDNICPSCREGVMVKVGGCTQCSKNCGFTGSCDAK
ncbi:adenosylcobalamin-dependent ribonucleoside-diphosphate reductase [Candidatus Woesearchaeota archaeon]|nr:adenosylcobalamin-dependent ribonucleoside-diphosphate reductase [Candidatus Woesearchaeota archaeon]